MPRAENPQLTIERRNKVKNWWEDRIRSGCQLHHSDLFMPGWDYKGKGPWFDAVTVHALYIDFIEDHPEERGYYYDSRFSKDFRQVASVQSVVRLRATMKQKNGKSYVTIQRTFFRFGMKPALDDELRAVLDGAA